MNKINNESKECLIKIKNIYGKETIYPANETSELILSLTGKRTFSNQDLRVIKALGYSIEVVPSHNIKID